MNVPGSYPGTVPGGRTGFSGSTPAVLAAALTGALLAFGEKLPCRDGAWNIPGKQFQLACYTDIYPLYFTERLASGKVPYTGHPVEYPVLIGAVMQAAAWLVHSSPTPSPVASGSSTSPWPGWPGAPSSACSPPPTWPGRPA